MSEAHDGRLGVVHDQVVEGGGDGLHELGVLDWIVLINDSIVSLTFQFRGNLVVSKMIFMSDSTAWWVSLLMLKIQLVEPVPVEMQRPLFRDLKIGSLSILTNKRHGDGFLPT